MNNMMVANEFYINNNTISTNNNTYIYSYNTYINSTYYISNNIIYLITLSTKDTFFIHPDVLRFEIIF